MPNLEADKIMRITDFEKVSNLENDDAFLIDGPAGTKHIRAEDLYQDVGKNAFDNLETKIDKQIDNKTKSIKQDIANLDSKIGDANENIQNLDGRIDGVSNDIKLTDAKFDSLSSEIQNTDNILEGLSRGLNDTKTKTDALREWKDNTDFVNGVKGESETNYRKGNVNITKANIGLGNVPNVSTNNQTPTFEQAGTRANINSGEKLSVIFGKIKKYFADLKTVAFSGSFNDLSNIPESLPANGGTAATISETLPISKGGTGQTTAVDALKALLDGITNMATATPTDDDWYLAKNANAGNEAPVKRKITALWDYIKSKLATVATTGSFNDLKGNIHYGTCGTAAATAAKVVACADYALKTGSVIRVKFTVTNTAANPTLNVNSTGAKAIYYRGAAIATGYLAANRVYEFVYDGTHYELVGDIDTDANTTYSDMKGATASAAGTHGLVPAPAAGAQGKYLCGDGTWQTPPDTVSGNAGTATKWATARNINGLSVQGDANRVNYGTCDTAAATAAKVVACTGFALITGSEITVKFTVTNTAANPTLNVNSTGAKAIYYRGAAISAGYLAANRTYTFRYNGTQYELVGDINTDTNTTYTAASEAPKANGTAAVGTSTKYAREDHVHPLQTSVSGNAGTATKLRESDTRNVDSPPSYYMTNDNGKGIITEFKIGSVIGLANINFVQLTTFNQWTDKTGGYPSQIATGLSSGFYYRRAKSETEWYDWQLIVQPFDKIYNHYFASSYGATDGRSARLNASGIRQVLPTGGYAGGITWVTNDESEVKGMFGYYSDNECFYLSKAKYSNYDGTLKLGTIDANSLKLNGNAFSITDTLLGTSAYSALSSKQGKVLNDKGAQMSVYVGDDKKLHFRDWSGADTVLNFSGNSAKFDAMTNITSTLVHAATSSENMYSYYFDIPDKNKTYIIYAHFRNTSNNNSLFGILQYRGVEKDMSFLLSYGVSISSNYGGVTGRYLISVGSDMPLYMLKGCSTS